LKIITALKSKSVTSQDRKEVEITVFLVDREVHIRSTDPEQLPPVVEILNFTGQKHGIYPLENKQENVIFPSLDEGVYLFVFRTKSGMITRKVPVIRQEKYHPGDSRR